jgi:RNA polymerase sigma-70 factor (ECF subfamily)
MAADVKQQQRRQVFAAVEDGLDRMTDADAAALVSRIQAGDSEALGELYRHGRRRVERYVARRMVDRNDVEDVVQETFLRALEMAGEFNPDGQAVGAWLCGRVASHTLRDYGRKDRFAKLSAAEAAMGAAMEAAHIGSGQSAHERESTPLSPRMVHALARLSPALRQSMQLRFMDEMTPAQAAEVAGTSAGAIAQNCTAARKRLRAEFADLAPVSTSALDGMTKKDAVLTALRTTDGDMPAALVWLREQGLTVDESYAYGVRNGRQVRTVRAQAQAECQPKSAAEIAAAEEEFARVNASRHATKKEVAGAAALVYEARNGRLPSPADLAALVEGVSTTTAIVALREVREGPAAGDVAATRGMAQHAAPAVGAQLPAVEKTDPARQPKRAQAYQAAQRFWSEQKELPICDELAEFAGMSRGTCAVVLQEIRAAIAAQPVPAHTTAEPDAAAESGSAVNAQAEAKPEPTAVIPVPRAAEPDSPVKDRATVALAESRRQTDAAVTAAEEAVQLREQPAQAAEVERERSQQVARWQDEDRGAGADRSRADALELAS